MNNVLDNSLLSKKGGYRDFLMLDEFSSIDALTQHYLSKRMSIALDLVISFFNNLITNKLHHLQDYSVEALRLLTHASGFAEKAIPAYDIPKTDYPISMASPLLQGKYALRRLETGALL